MTITPTHLKQLGDAVNSLKSGTGERGQYRAFLGDGRGVGNIINAIPPTYREVWVHTGNQAGSQAAGQQILSLPLSWLASLVIPYVNDPQYEGLPVVIGYAPGSSTLEVLRPDGLGAAAMLRNPGLYSRENWFVQPPGTCQGRLTAVSGQAYGDAATYTTLLFTPYGGNRAGTYNGYTWRVKPFSELSLSLSGFAANQNFDIFLLDNSGSPILTSIGWSSNTARATALVQQDGIWVASGLTTYRYLGTIRTTGTIGQGTDSVTQRYLWNFYNRLPRPVRVADGTASWTYATGSWRQVNANTANKIELVCGFASDEALIRLDIHHLANDSTGALIQVGSSVGLDSTTVPSANDIGHFRYIQGAVNSFGAIHAVLDDNVPLGYHAYNWLELGAAPVTFYGTAPFSGMSGHYWC